MSGEIGLRVILGIALAIGTMATGWGQPAPVAASPTVKLPEFDVVSIKENKSDRWNFDFDNDDSELRIKWHRLSDLLKQAYHLNTAADGQIIGLQGWQQTARFDIEAKFAPTDLTFAKNVTDDQLGDMLRGVLVDRFHLVAHLETRQLPVYELRVLKHGPKLTPNNPQVAAGQDSDVAGCKVGCIAGWRRHLDAKGVGMDRLAEALTRRTQRPVIDKTGLTGSYDFSLNWTPDNERNEDVDQPPRIFVAIQQQLGLQLVPAKDMVKVLVVDHVELPTAN